MKQLRQASPLAWDCRANCSGWRALPFWNKTERNGQGKRAGLSKGARFISSSNKEKKRMIEKIEESENNNRSRRSRLFLCDNKGHMIFQPPLQPAGQRFLLAPQHPALYSAHNHTRTACQGIRIWFFFLLGCYPEHSNLIRPFDKHLTQSSGLLSLLPTAQGKRLRLTNFHPQFSLFYLHLSNSMPVSVTQRWGKSKPLSS